MNFLKIDIHETDNTEVATINNGLLEFSKPSKLIKEKNIISNQRRQT